MKLEGSARSCTAVTIAGGSVTEGDTASLGADAARGRFKKLDDAKAHVAVADAGLVFEDALCEVSHRGLERLGGLDVRAPDVAAAVVDAQPVDLFGSLGHLDAPVVDLDRLGR